MEEDISTHCVLMYNIFSVNTCCVNDVFKIIEDFFKINVLN